jgi:hypothetical protein
MESEYAAISGVRLSLAVATSYLRAVAMLLDLLGSGGDAGFGGG